MIYIGIDNGVTGSWAIVEDTGEVIAYFPTPVHLCLNYTKAKANVNRVDVQELRDLLREHLAGRAKNMIRIFMERPMVNPKRYQATLSAIRCLEATLIALESLKLPLTDYLDSKAWQKEIFPNGLKGSAALKDASLQLGIRNYPHLKAAIMKQKDADALLIAEYARRVKL